MNTAVGIDLAGALWLRPGLPPPHNLRGTRRDWAARLAPGRALSDWPTLLASLYNQCGHAHRLCSQLAIAAAAPELPPPDTAAAAQRLRAETAREHLARIALDWPRQLADGDASCAATARAALAESPLLRASAPATAAVWAAQRRWLAQALLQMPADDWLRNWQADGADWLQHWCRTHDGWLAQLLRQARALDLPVALPASHTLTPPQPADLPWLANALAQQTDFALQPDWRGAWAHTGCWSRTHGRPPPSALSSPWALLGCRLADLLHLCQNDGDAWLAFGARSSGPASGPRQGLAWVETGRGLLLHQVRLAEPDDAAVAPHLRQLTHLTHLASAQVLPPTAWNFHPAGAAARILERIAPAAPTIRGAVGLIAASLDPCVPLHLEAPAHHACQPSEEAAHA